MTPEERQDIIRRLEAGEELSTEWARTLFPPEKREYELVYHGKERKEDILANTLAVPLQAVRTFGKNGGTEWHNMLIFGDNLQIMKSLLELKKAGKLCNADGTPGVRLAYIDSPFATKQEFRGTQDQKAYQDKIAGARFVEFLRQRLVLIHELLSDDGSLYVHLDQRKIHYAKIVLDEIFGEENFRNEIIWRNTNSHNKAETFGQIHQSLLLYTRSARFYFRKTFRPRFRAYVENHYRHTDKNGEKFRHSDPTGAEIRAGESGQQWQGYNPTAKGRHWAIPGFIYDLVEDDISGMGVLEKLDYLLEHGFIELPEKRGGQPQIKRPASVGQGNPMQDIWAYQPYTQGIYAENKQAIDEDVTWALGDAEATGYPTQKPEGVLARVIQSSSKEGDIVLDAFSGGGTTCAVGEKLGRRWVAIDCGKLAIYTMQKRLLNLRKDIGNTGPKLDCKPFTLHNAGLYDFSTLKTLPWSDWRFFALQLFGCKDELHTIGGLKLDGKLKGASVLVFNHHENPGKRIDEETIRDIHAAVGKKIGRKFFVIAPRGVFDFQQDYIDLEGVRYYALRIPYSFINELHHRNFTALKQPNDEKAVNETVDAVGFDFIRPPKVDWSVGVKKRKGQLLEEAFLKVKKFQSYARLRGEETHGGLESFSMLMLDFDYDGEVFDFDAVFYAHQLEEAEWEAWFPVETLGAKVMAVFIDIHGNEAGEVIARQKFGLTAGKAAGKVRKAVKV